MPCHYGRRKVRKHKANVRKMHGRGAKKSGKRYFRKYMMPDLGIARNYGKLNTKWVF